MELQVDLFFFGFDGIALGTLIGGVFAHEAQSAVHLRQVVGTEDEHQLALSRTVAMHIAHRLDVVLLALVELFLQLVKLCAQHFNLYVKI